MRFSPLPAGMRFAVSFVDDTDRATRELIEPVYECLHEHGLRGTKTVWTLDQRRSSSYRRAAETTVPRGDLAGVTTENPEYRSFVLDLQRRGFEIALHNVAAGNSYRDEIVEGLDRFRAIFGSDPAINVFHQTNIENLYCGSAKLDIPLFRLMEAWLHRSDYQGHVEGSPYFWGDLIRGRIKYVRLPFHTIPDVNTLRLNPSMPFHDPRRPFVNYWFASSDGADYGRFTRLLCDANVNRLERDAGACIAYVHLADGFAEARDGRFVARDGFRALVARLASRRGAWFPTASGLLDRLAAIRLLSAVQEGRTVRIENTGEVAVHRVAMQFGRPVVLKDASGGDCDQADEHEVAIATLPPGSSVRLTVGHDASARIEPSQRSNTGRLERARIEFRNYVGLVKQDLLRLGSDMPAVRRGVVDR